MSKKFRSSEDKSERRALRKGRSRGRKNLKRLFAHGDLRFLILSLVAEKPRHGYDLIKEISDRVAGAYSPSPGVIYPTLSMLEDLGWVTVNSDHGTKKLHVITEEGRLALKVNQPLLDDIFGRMDEARAAQRAALKGDDSEVPSAHTSINHARKALKTALRRRADDEALSEGQVVAIVTALLDAADRIENA